MIEQILLFLASPIVTMVGVTGLVGAVCLVVWFLAPAWLPINRSHLLWAGISALACGAFSTYWFHEGESYMMRKIAAKDSAAIERKDEAIKNVDECFNTGGRWDVTTGTCGK